MHRSGVSFIRTVLVQVRVQYSFLGLYWWSSQLHGFTSRSLGDELAPASIYEYEVGRCQLCKPVFNFTTSIQAFNYKQSQDVPQ